MRILLVHQYFLGENQSGGSRWNEIADQWVTNGHEVTVLAGMVHYTTGNKDEKFKGRVFLREKTSKGIEVIRCHVSEAYNINFLGRLWAYFSFVITGTLGGIFYANGKYDIIIVTSPPLFVGIIAFNLSWIKKTPFLFEIRDLWPESAIDTGILSNKLLIKLSYWFEKFIYRKAILINVLTPAFRDVLINQKQIAPEKIIMIPNAADFVLTDNLLETFNREEFRENLGISDKFVIIYVGAHGIANGLVQILETAKLLKETEVYFLLIGDGMEKKRLMDYAEEKALENVRFISSVPKSEVFKYILASDMGTSVLVKNDTFKTVYSNKTFDYMSCKKPILMAIDGISRELVETADAGIFIEPEDAIDFSNKIKLYLSNPSKVLKQGENGYKFAKKNFDRTVLSQKYLENIQRCIG